MKSWINRNAGVGVGGDSRWAHILVNVGEVLARLRVEILALSVRVCVIQTHDHEALAVHNTKRRKRNRKAV